MSQENLKEFAQWVRNFTEEKKPEITTHDGRDYLMTTSGMKEILLPLPSTVNVVTLTGIIDFIAGRKGLSPSPNRSSILHVESPTSVSLYDENVGLSHQKFTFLTAKALVPEIRFGKFMEQDQFIIQAQSCFVHGLEDHLEAVLSVAGNITEEKVQDTLDDGVSQVVTAKQGVSTKTNIVVPKKVALTPIRSFVEIAQPTSEFVFRIQDGPEIALFEADGGAWRNEAMIRVKKWLEQELGLLGLNDKFTIIA